MDSSVNFQGLQTRLVTVFHVLQYLDDVSLALAVAACEGRVDGRRDAQFFSDSTSRTGSSGLGVQHPKKVT